MGEVADALAAEFSDLSAVQAVQLAVRLLVAGAIGGLLGWERERAGKAAGLRTHILVAVGTAGVVAVQMQAVNERVPASGWADPVSRVLQGLITGIGFIGAGCILKMEDRGTIRGLTTAAGIWLTAAVGITAGMGRELSAVLIGAVGWFTLSVLGRWEARITSPDEKSKG